METTRQNKISRLIQKELSEIFMLQTKAMKGVLVSVSACRISPDLSICRVYLSIFPSRQHESHPLRTGDTGTPSVTHHPRIEILRR